MLKDGELTKLRAVSAVRINGHRADAKKDLLVINVYVMDSDEEFYASMATINFLFKKKLASSP